MISFLRIQNYKVPVTKKQIDTNKGKLLDAKAPALVTLIEYKPINLMYLLDNLLLKKKHD
jgi:hypothetical protein